jgi:hypothetical protein
MLLPACTADAPQQPVQAKGSGAAFARAGYDTPGAHRQYGTPVKLGNGQARTYAVLDSKAGQAPLEVGVALDERALDGLPTSHTMLALPMALPTHGPLPYRSVVLNWNPQGHFPDGVYDVPHFDVHFYFTSQAEVEAITPSDPEFAAKANNVPTGDFVPRFYIVPAAPGDDPATVAEPNMGVHWVDVRSPELQMLLGPMGDPSRYQPFTRTFIYGSWNGRFTFLEPMVTRAYLLSRPDETMPISKPARYPEAGWYPDAYRITYDAQAKEYRVGLVGLSRRD